MATKKSQTAVRSSRRRTPPTAREAHEMLTGKKPVKVDSALIKGLLQRDDPKGTTLAAVRRYVESGGDVNELHTTPRVFMESLLHLAVAHGHLEITRYLLEHGADANLPNGGPGETPLQIAVGPWDDPKLVALLLDHGAAIDGPPEADRTPLAEAIAAGRTRIATLLRKRGAREG